MPLINRCGGSSTPQLCAQVENFKAILGDLNAVLSWTAPNDDSFVGVRIIRKIGSAPQNKNDGTVVYEGTALTYTDTGLVSETVYYYRAFAYNAGKRYQTAKCVLSVKAIPVYTILDQNSWEIIRYISDIDQAANYWSVGDAKGIFLTGDVGDGFSTNALLVYAFIVGFNHNAELEGEKRIHFQIGKSTPSGSDVCLCDSAYGTTLPSTVGLGAYFYMITSSNSGGWEASFMRNTILGTDINSSGNTLVHALPEELRSTMKSVQKYSNNTGSTNYGAKITATTDYLFLPSEFEVFGTHISASSLEQNYQKQYDYYSAGNSKIKYKHSDISAAVKYWLRSCYGISDYNALYLAINSDGTMGDGSIRTSFGIAPMFCV